MRTSPVQVPLASPVGRCEGLIPVLFHRTLHSFSFSLTIWRMGLLPRQAGLLSYIQPLPWTLNLVLHIMCPPGHHHWLTRGSDIGSSWDGQRLLGPHISAHCCRQAASSVPLSHWGGLSERQQIWASSGEVGMSECFHGDSCPR